MTGGDLPDLFNYLDPGQYVCDMRRALRVSYGRLSKATRRSSSYLHRLCNGGAARVTRDMIPGLATVFGLSDSERAYLEKLVEYQDVEDPLIKKRKLVGLLETRLGREVVEARERDVVQDMAQLRVLLSWEAMSLYVLIQRHPIADDEHLIADLFLGKIEARKVRASIEQLVRAGLVDRRDGSLVATSQSQITIDYDVHMQEAMKMFHVSILGKAAEAVTELDGSMRLSVGRMVAVTRRQYERMMEQADDFIRTALEQGSSPASEDEEIFVVHAGAYVFPLVRYRDDEELMDERSTARGQGSGDSEEEE